MKLSKRDLILLAVIAAAAVVGGFWYLIVKPAAADASASRERLEQVEAESEAIRDTLARLSADRTSEAQRAAERLRLAKALPETAAVPGAMVQLQRIADRANVEFAALKTNAASAYGPVTGTEFEIRVVGRFLDVDDFMFRVHRLVEVDERDRPVVSGRLFAVTGIDMALAQDGSAPSDSLAPDDEVEAIVKVVAFSGQPPAAAAVSTAPVGAPAPPAGGGSTNEPATQESPGGSPQ